MKLKTALFIYLSAHQAYRVSNAIKTTIEGNVNYQLAFPKVQLHPDKRSQEEWKVKGSTVLHSTFVACGIAGPALGYRASIVALDDIGDKENMATPYQREGIRDSLNHTIMPILVPWGRVVMLATRWAFDDPVDWAIAAPPGGRGWKNLYLKALLTENEEERSYWPERFTLEWLQHERQQSPKSFARQYQNEVTPEEGITFQRWWFPRYEEHPEVMWRIVSFDTAAGLGKNRSYTAGWAAYVTRDFHIYLIDLILGQFPWGQLKETAAIFSRVHRAQAILIEDASSGKQLIAEMRTMREFHQRVFGQKAAGSGVAGEKEARIVEAADFCREARVHLPSEAYARAHGISWLAPAEEQIFSFEGNPPDDIVMSLVQLIHWVRDQEKRRRRMAVEEVPYQWADSRAEQEKLRI